MSLLGAILAGGGSRRFGSPKTLARLHGTPLWKVAAGRLREVCDDVVAIVNHPGVSRAVELETLPDRLRLMGPLGGIDAALDRALRDGYTAVMVLAVDMPWVETGALRLLADAWREQGARLARGNGAAVGIASPMRGLPGEGHGAARGSAEPAAAGGGAVRPVARPAGRGHGASAGRVSERESSRGSASSGHIRHREQEVRQDHPGREPDRGAAQPGAPRHVGQARPPLPPRHPGHRLLAAPARGPRRTGSSRSDRTSSGSWANGTRTVSSPSTSC